MADRLSLNAADAPRAQDKTVEGGGSIRARKARLDRDLAELASLLSQELKESPSPSIAANDDEEAEQMTAGEAAPAHPQVRPARRMPRVGTQAPESGSGRELRRRRPLRAERAWNDNAAGEPEHPHDLDAHLENDENFERWEPTPEPVLEAIRAPRSRRLVEEVPLYVSPRVPQRSIVQRALRVAATLFSLVALVGVSALLVLLAVGDRTAAPVVEDAVQADRLAVVPDSVNVSPPAAQQGEPAVITGSTGAKRDQDRILADEASPVRAGGVVRAADAQEAPVQPQEPAESAPASAPAASASVAIEPVPAQAAPAEEPAAPRETAVASTGSIAAPAPREPAAEATPAARTARVNAHVNLRAKPENDAAVVTIVPEGKSVQIVECTRWCEVAYEGRQGFVHKRFMRGVQ